MPVEGKMWGIERREIEGLDCMPSMVKLAEAGIVVAGESAPRRVDDEERQCRNNSDRRYPVSILARIRKPANRPSRPCSKRCHITSNTGGLRRCGCPHRN